MDEFKDTVIQVYDLEVEYRNFQNLPYRSGKTDKKGYTNEYLGRISYFYTWNEGIVQIGLLLIKKRKRFKDVELKMLEFEVFNVRMRLLLKNILPKT